MSEEEYLKERIDDQISWYGKKSTTNKKYYHWSNALIILFAALIPFISNFDTILNIETKFIIAALGVLTAVFTGVSALYKFQEKWTTYRITSEALKREKHLYLTKTSPYNRESGSFNLLVSNVETLMNSEQTGWMQIINKKDKQSEG